MFTLLVWGINMCAPVHAQNKLDSLQHLNEVVVTARAVQKEIFPVQELSGKAQSSCHLYGLSVVFITPEIQSSQGD